MTKIDNLGGKSPAQLAETLSLELPFNLAISNIKMMSVEQSKVMQLPEFVVSQVTERGLYLLCSYDQILLFLNI